MKTAKIKKVILQAGDAVLYRHYGEQWVGTLQNIYSLSGLPELKLQHLPRLLDIDQDKFAGLGFVEEMELAGNLDELISDAENNSDTLRVMTLVEAEVKLYGTELAMLQDDKRYMVFLSQAQLAPISFTPQTRFLCSRIEKHDWVVVMDGLFAVALLRCRTLSQDAATLMNEIAAAAVSWVEEE